MCQFVGKREDLSSLGVCTVDEHDGSPNVYQCESPELIWVEFSVGVATNDSVNHHQDSDVLGLLSESGKGIRPRGKLVSSVQAEPKNASEGLRCFDYGIRY